jgi:cytochrome c peroxidase
VIFDGPHQNEDFGTEQITGQKADRYKFRTSPLRNVALQPAFFHNGAFTRLREAIRHHLDVRESVRRYNPVTAGLDADLTLRIADMTPVLETIDPLLKEPIELTREELDSLVHFVRYGLTDRRARPQLLCALVPASLPSGMPPMEFEGCR